MGPRGPAPAHRYGPPGPGAPNNLISGGPRPPDIHKTCILYISGPPAQKIINYLFSLLIPIPPVRAEPYSPVWAVPYSLPAYPRRGGAMYFIFPYYPLWD